MKKPAMILFDYGGTLVRELGFDPVKGTQAVLHHAVSNPRGLGAIQVQAEADQLNRELGRGNALAEVHNFPFQNYLYASLGIRLDIGNEEIEECFWDGASGLEATEGIESFLAWLFEKGIRTGVISNLSFSQKALVKRIGRILPDHHFELILASSEVVFRKPSPRIFQLALTLAGLEADQVWYCGDRPQYDVAGAKGAGLFPVWYTGALEEEIADEENCLRINHWDELKKMIEGGEDSDPFRK